MKQTAREGFKVNVKVLFQSALFVLLAASQMEAAMMLALSPNHTGNYWWNRSQTSFGISSNEGFSYGDSGSGLIHAQRLYDYYGGADRYFEAKDMYFQIPLDTLDGLSINSVSFNFYVETLNTTAETFLKHLGTQLTAPTGDAAQELAGSDNVFSSTAMTVGWNEVDVTDEILSDLGNDYAYAVFSIPQFAQVMDQNRLLSIYGASAPDVDGTSVKPYFEIVAVPEPSAYGSVLAGLALVLVFVRRR